jgi:peptidoglycan hydrolase-like protein with peptidoglycan-binding domain
VSAWFAPTHAAPGEPRSLRLAVPPVAGKDVTAVQRAFAAAHFDLPQTGLYDAATALAIGRFQKRNGLNLDGVADSATLHKLSVEPERAEPNQPPGAGRPARRIRGPPRTDRRTRQRALRLHERRAKQPSLHHPPATFGI